MRAYWRGNASMLSPKGGPALSHWLCRPAFPRRMCEFGPAGVVCPAAGRRLPWGMAPTRSRKTVTVARIKTAAVQGSVRQAEAELRESNEQLADTEVGTVL